MTMLLNRPPTNPSDPTQNRVRNNCSNISKYCWCHVVCDKCGCDFTRKRQGHNNAVKFANKMS